jgi:hypothetical protein
LRQTGFDGKTNDAVLYTHRSLPMQKSGEMSKALRQRGCARIQLFGLPQGELIAVETLDCRHVRHDWTMCCECIARLDRNTCTVLNGKAIAILHCSSGSRAL